MGVALPQDLDDFMNAIHEVYGHLDNNRSEEEIWLDVVEESSRIGESVREVRYDRILDQLTNLFVWLCGFIKKCNNETSICFFKEDFSSVIWLKFPDACPRCGARPCGCLSRWRELLQREKAQKEEAYGRILKKAIDTLSSRIRNLDHLVGMFDEIYGNNIEVTDIKEVAFHLLEEVGEVSEQLRELRALGQENETNKEKKGSILNEVKQELADVFAWLAGLTIKVNLLAVSSIHISNVMLELTGKEKINLSTESIDRTLLRRLVLKNYSDGEKMICRTCKLPKCEIARHEKRYLLKESK